MNHAPTAGDRAARRAFIRDSHPDRGGDAAAFVAGLARFDGSAAPRRHAAPTVYRSRRPGRVLVRALRRVRRHLGGRPARTLL